jgi:BirA family biotin operon repressor/biotin-[acetyl-CoA-carboxylase] ligase
MDTKGKILHFLRETPSAPVSGEFISERLGVSRVSVWKHIHKLQELGYPIDSGPNGYQLGSEPDLLFPWEFPGREKSVHFFERVDSTMDVARELARKGCPAFTVVVAEIQTRGRGRLKRSWHSDKGGLYFTVVLRPEVPPALSFRFNFAASLVLVRLLRRNYDVDAWVKWPNDILVGDKKLCGMLSEMETEADWVSFVNVGLGINVNNDPSQKESASTSLAALLKRPLVRKRLLAAFLDDLEKRMAEGDLENIVSQWKAYTGTIGRDVKIVTLKETLSGKAVDIDSDGALILELPDGRRERVIYGDCFYA